MDSEIINEKNIKYQNAADPAIILGLYPTEISVQMHKFLKLKKWKSKCQPMGKRLKIIYTWFLNNIGVRGTDPACTQKSAFTSDSPKT